MRFSIKGVHLNGINSWYRWSSKRWEIDAF